MKHITRNQLLIAAWSLHRLLPPAHQLFIFLALPPAPVSSSLPPIPDNKTAARQSGLFGVNFKDQIIGSSPLFVSHKIVYLIVIYHSLLINDKLISSVVKQPENDQAASLPRSRVQLTS